MSTPLRIILVGPASPAWVLARLSGELQRWVPRGMGGAPVNELCVALVEAGHDVTLVTASPDLTDRWEASTERLRIRVVPFRIRARDRAVDLFRRERLALEHEVRAAGPVDVVHAHWTYEFALAALRVDRDALITAHDAPLTVLGHHRDLYRLVRLLMAITVRLRVRRLAVVSPYLGERWRMEMRWRGDIAILPNIAPDLDGSVAAPAARGPQVLTVANDDPLKNVATLIRAWPAVTRSVSEAELHLVGPGLGTEDRLAARANCDGAKDSVWFHGVLTREALSVRLAEAVVMAHPSLEECHPMAVIEAMRAGVPVIGGSRSGGVPWTLGGGTAGALCDVGDSDALAATLIEVLRSPELRDRYRAHARKRVDELFSPDAAVAAHEAIYRRDRGDVVADGASVPERSYRIGPVTIAAHTVPSAARQILSAAGAGRRLEVHLCNSYTIALADRDQALRASLTTADLNLADGVPVAAIGRLKGYGVGAGLVRAVRGPSLFRETVRAGIEPGVSHYLYGGVDGVAEEVVRQLRSTFPGVVIAGVETPPFRDMTDAEVQDLATRVVDSGAHILWIGLGTPKQDFLVSRIGQLVSMPVVPIGAAFDFVAGRVREAPAWLRESGLEWVHRLTREPGRLWRRYLVDSPQVVRIAVADLMVERSIARRRVR